jgi:tetratricopeptide (TPR) repeat protein
LVRETAEALVQEMQAKLAQLADLQGSVPNNRDIELSVAIGAMSTGSFSDAAAHFDTYAHAEDDSWEANLARGVAHANARVGRDSNIASLRAYNEAIALAPIDIDQKLRARMYAYRGAILKRLNRLSEAEADLRYALTLARDRYELTDIHYNLACIHAMRGEKDHMLTELAYVKSNQQYMNAIRAHRLTYFARFADDPDFVRVLS